jgi:predicted nucleic acid-binding protein
LILYIDTSALVPLMIEEPSSTACGELWDAADDVATTRLTYVEAAAAVAMASRLRRIPAPTAEMGLGHLRQLWEVVNVIELDESLMLSAARLARMHQLRGYDAMHCAAAIALDDELVVAASGDARLLTAWRAAGLAVRDTSR